MVAADINMIIDPVIIVFMQNPSWNADVFHHVKHLKAAKPCNAALRHLAHESSSLNETRAVIFSYKAPRSETLIQCAHKYTRKHTRTNCCLCHHGALPKYSRFVCGLITPC